MTFAPAGFAWQADAVSVTSDGGTRGRGGASTPRLERWSSGRERYVDNLKVLLIATVIVGHAIVGYTEFDWWAYADVREVSLASTTAIILLVVAAPFGLLVIPLLFLVAGLLTPPSLEHKGPGRFSKDRLLRLGVPFLVFAVLMWPLLEYGLFRWLGGAPDLWTYLLAERSLDTACSGSWARCSSSPSPRRRGRAWGPRLTERGTSRCASLTCSRSPRS